MIDQSLPRVTAAELGDRAAAGRAAWTEAPVVPPRSPSRASSSRTAKPTLALAAPTPAAAATTAHDKAIDLALSQTFPSVKAAHDKAMDLALSETFPSMKKNGDASPPPSAAGAPQQRPPSPGDEHALRLVGFWRKYADVNRDRSDPRPYPVPGGSERLPAADRMDLVEYCSLGYVESYELGYASCRLCGACGPDMGCTALTDGTWCWPEGYSHYVSYHGITPPREVGEGNSAHQPPPPANAPRGNSSPPYSAHQTINPLPSPQPSSSRMQGQTWRLCAKHTGLARSGWCGMPSGAGPAPHRPPLPSG